MRGLPRVRSSGRFEALPARVLQNASALPIVADRRIGLRNDETYAASTARCIHERSIVHGLPARPPGTIAVSPVRDLMIAGSRYCTTADASSRRSVVLYRAWQAIVVLAAALGPSLLLAQEYPSKAIRWVVPYPTGGTSDFL